MTHWVKFARAHEHLEEIKAVVKGFTDMRPHRFISEYEPEAFKEGDRVKFTYRLHAPVLPPAKLAVLVGDCLNNLRASLDHLVFAVALKHAGSAIDENRSLQFPIYTDAKRFATWQGKVAPLLPADALTVIEQKQPYVTVAGYNPPDVFMRRGPLWILNALTNADKHRTLSPITKVRITVRNVRVDAGKSAFPFGTFTFSGSREHGAEILAFEFVADAPNAKVTMEETSVTDVAFSDERPAKGRMVLETLKTICDKIREDVFPALEPFL